MNTRRIESKNIKEQYVSDYGMTMELFVEQDNGEIDREIDYPLLKIYADEETEEQYLELPTQAGLVQIPISKVKSFIESASEVVRSEAWCDNNAFNEPNDT